MHDKHTYMKIDKNLSQHDTGDDSKFIFKSYVIRNWNFKKIILNLESRI